LTKELPLSLVDIMSIKINYLRDGEGIEFIAFGGVTGTEVIEANKKIYNRGNLLRLKYKIVDRTNCTEYLVKAEEIQIIAEQEKEAAKVNPNFIIALISSSTLQYAMSRMWQLYVEANESGLRTAVFKDRKSAEKWIKEQLVKSSKGNKKQR
jgi:hypothetical protein